MHGWLHVFDDNFRYLPGPYEGLKIRGRQYCMVGIICSPSLVEIGLTDLLKSGGAVAPPAPLGATPLCTCDDN